jgi:hypothetical protein
MFLLLLLYVSPHLLHTLAHLNPASSVRVLPWFHNPQQLFLLLTVLRTLLVLYDRLIFLFVASEVKGEGNVVKEIVVELLAVTF